MTDTAIDVQSEELPPPTTLVPVRDTSVSIARRQSPADLAVQAQEIRELMRAVLVEGTDYGRIPGVDRPSLFKSGAEWLLKWAGFGHRLDPVEIERDVDGRKFGVTYRATVHLLQDPACVVSTCDGYAGYDEDRFMQSVQQLERKERANASKYHRAANEWKWAEEYRAPWNSVLKMAEKRAMVGAVLQACAASGLFTQDMEDTRPPVEAAAEPAEFVPASDEDYAELRRRIAALPDDGQQAVKDAVLATRERDGVEPLGALDKFPARQLARWKAVVAAVESRARNGEWGDWAPPADPETGEVATTPSAPPVTADDTTPVATEETTGDGSGQATVEQPTLLSAMTDTEVIAEAGDENTKVTVAVVKAMSEAKVDSKLEELGLATNGAPDTRRQRLTIAFLRKTIADRK